MKKVNKILVLLLSLMLVMTSLVACGNTAEDDKSVDSDVNEEAQASGDTEDESEASVEMETITVWTDSAHEKHIRERQVEEFNNTTGKELGIEIDYTVFGDNFTDTLKIAAQAEEAPHLFRADSKLIIEFIEAGYVVPIDDLPGSEDLLDKYSDLLANQSQIFDCKTYTLPYTLTTYGFVVNKDLFEASGLSEDDYPKTWDDVVEIAKIITEESNGDAYGFGIAPGAQWTISSFFTFGAGQNIGHYGYDYEKQQFAYSDYNPMIKAIDQMVADGSVIPGYETLDADMLRAQFSAGTIGMLGAASFDAAVYNEQFPAQIDWEVIDIPTFEEGESPYKRFGLPTNFLMPGVKALDSPEKTLKVLEFFYDDKNAAEMYEEGLHIPIRSEAIAMATKDPEMKNFSAFAEFDDIFPMPPVPDTLIKFEGGTYREAIANMWTDPELNDVDAVMAEIDEKYNKALAEVDQETVDLYILPEGVNPEKSK